MSSASPSPSGADEPSTTPPSDDGLHGSVHSLRAAKLLYRWRWPTTILIVGFVVGVFAMGVGRVASFSASVAALEDTSNGSGAVKPLFFDPSMDVWFGAKDEAVQTYYDIENTFVAEDFVMVTYEETEHPLGVFSQESLATIARLTERFLTVPGVRHVRSLTYNPWIRWGRIEDELGVEDGLIISDLVEGSPAELSDADIVERMVATLGAAGAASKLGAERVREVIGEDADFSRHIGEPRLVGTILNESATATVIQVQILRPRIDEERIEEVFQGSEARRVGPNLSSIEQQRAALRGIEHFLRIEKGLALPTPERAELEAWIDGLPPSDERQALALELRNPNKNFMRGPDGELVRKFYEYDRVESAYVDRTEPSDLAEAPPDFEPSALSPYEFHLGGIPLFERNFEEVGIADGKYVPLMFLVIIVVLAVVFRRVIGVVAPLIVVFGSIMGMIGLAFARGDLLNNLTMMSPNMLTAVGIADAIHIVASWLLLRPRFDDKPTLIFEVMRRNALPVLLTSVTTAVGFYSLTVSEITPVQQLGSMAALGTFFAWALSMSVVPALLSLVPHHPTSAERPHSLVGRVFSERRMHAFVGLVVDQRAAILAVTAVLVIVGAFGLYRVEIDSDFRGMFPHGNRTMRDFSWIEDRMGGVGDLEIVFTGVSPGERVEPTVAEEARRNELAVRELGHERDPDAFEPLSEEERAELVELRAKVERWNSARIGVSPRFLERLDAFEARLRREMVDASSPLSVLTDFVSPLDTLRKIHQVQHENRAEYYRVPGPRDIAEAAREPALSYDEWTEEWSYTPAQDASTLVAQYYLQYESGARPGEALWTQLSADRTQFRMESRVLQDSSVAHLAAFERIEAIARDEFPELVADVRTPAAPHTAEAEGAKTAGDALSEFTISGKTLLFARTSDLFARGFVQSMGIALLAITALIGLLFQSWRFALVSLVPNVLPIVLPLAAFGLLGRPLDGPSILVSTVALGVCVDDTIHFLTKFRRARVAGASPREALEHTLSEAGAALTLTTVVLMIGFATLLLSEFAPNFQMGALAVLMIALAWVADFVVTTALLSFGATRAKIARDSGDATASAV